MVDVNFKVSGLDIHVKLNNGLHFYNNDSATGKTYFARLAKDATALGVFNAKVIDIDNISDLNLESTYHSDIIIIENATYILSSIEDESMIFKMFESLPVVADVKDYEAFLSDIPHSNVNISFDLTSMEVFD